MANAHSLLRIFRMHKIGKKLYSLLLGMVLCCFATIQKATATNLLAGDLIFTAYDADGTNATEGDKFSFVLLKDIDAGTLIYFTERGMINGVWQGSGTTEGTVSWTSVTNLTIGTEVYVYDLTAKVNSVTNGSMATVSGGGTNGLSLSNAGDQIMAFQGNGGDPTGSVTGSQDCIGLIQEQVVQLASPLQQQMPVGIPAPLFWGLIRLRYLLVLQEM